MQKISKYHWNLYHPFDVLELKLGRKFPEFKFIFIFFFKFNINEASKLFLFNCKEPSLIKIISIILYDAHFTKSVIKSFFAKILITPFKINEYNFKGTNFTFAYFSSWDSCCIEVNCPFLSNRAVSQRETEKRYMLSGRKYILRTPTSTVSLPLLSMKFGGCSGTESYPSPSPEHPSIQLRVNSMKNRKWKNSYLVETFFTSISKGFESTSILKKRIFGKQMRTCPGNQMRKCPKANKKCLWQEIRKCPGKQMRKCSGKQMKSHKCRPSS